MPKGPTGTESGRAFFLREKLADSSSFVVAAYFGDVALRFTATSCQWFGVLVNGAPLIDTNEH
jgi:hypothetical protein